MSSAADDLLAWLTTAMDAAQRDAEAACDGGEGRWQRDGSDYAAGRIEDDRREVVVYDEGSPTEEQAAHIVRHDPAAVLRRIAADRKLLASHFQLGIDAECARCVVWDEDDQGDLCATPEPYPCTTVRSIAEGYGWTEMT